MKNLLRTTLTAVIFCLFAPIAAQAGTNAALRSLYWNSTYAQSTEAGSFNTSIAEIHSLHVDRVHLWLNDQPGSHTTCATHFAYAGWTRPQLASFIARLKAENIQVILTLSPTVPSSLELAALKEPISLAADVGADIEFDMEGNWTATWGPHGCEADGTDIGIDRAEQLLLDEVRAGAPTTKIGVTCAGTHCDVDHQVLLKKADWIAPQLYDRKAAALVAGVRDIEKRYPLAHVRPAIRVDSNLEYLISGFGAARSLGAVDERVDGYAIWAHNELTYASRMLHNTP